MIPLPQRTSGAWLTRMRHPIMAIGGGAAVIAMSVIAVGCQSTGNQAPSTPTTTTTTTPSTTTSPSSTTPLVPAPTEKGIDPHGGNLFTPQVIAPPAPTEPPGVHRRHG